MITTSDIYYSKELKVQFSRIYAKNVYHLRHDNMYIYFFDDEYYYIFNMETKKIIKLPEFNVFNSLNFIYRDDYIYMTQIL